MHERLCVIRCSLRTSVCVRHHRGDARGRGGDAHGRGGDVHGRGGDVHGRGRDARGRGGDAHGRGGDARGCAHGAHVHRSHRIPHGRIPGMMEAMKPRGPILHRQPMSSPATMSIEASSPPRGMFCCPVMDFSCV